MQSDLLSHALNREFPELSATVAHLKAHDHHFLRLLNEHDDVDTQITKDETGVAPMGDESLEALKRRRLHLKDELYQIAVKAKAEAAQKS